MSKNLKIGLWVGVPLGIIIIAGVIIGFSGNRYGAESIYLMDGSRGGAFAPMAPDVEEKNIARDSSPGLGIRTQASTGDTASDIVQERLIIKTGEIAMVVENVRGTAQTISDYAIEKGGFVVSSFVEKSGLELYGTVVVRVPVAVFDQTQEDVKSMGEVTSQSVNGQDVTEEYVDLDAQLRNFRATEDQFLDIMERAVKIEDVLAVQRELTWVRQEIERVEGRMKYLQQSADLSTMTVYLSTDPDVLPLVDTEDQWKPWAVITNAARSLVDLGQGLVNMLIWIVVYIPLWLLVWIVAWLVVRMVKRHRNKKLSV